MEPTIMGTPISGGGAIFNADRTKRFALWRRIEENYDMLKPSRFVLFVGLNPSIANETILDPTVTRCYNFAKRWGFTHLLMGNLYGTVSTDPKGVDFSKLDLENSYYLADMHNLAERTVVCWGSNAEDKITSEAIYFLRHKPLYAFAVNANGSPKHPLYLRGDAEVTPYPFPESYLKARLAVAELLNQTVDQ